MQNIISSYLKNLSIEQLTEMQQTMFDRFHSVDNIVLYSPTGSGKTIGFLLPLIVSLDAKNLGVQAIILAPSRELAIQIEQVFKKFRSNWKVNCCYGGHEMRVEQNNLSVAPSVIIGTPGRIADHIRRGSIDCSNVKTIILDEFDKALEFGFQDEMKFIIMQLRNLKKRLLISATRIAEMPDFAMPQKPEVLDYLTQSVELNLQLRQIRAVGRDKLQALYQLLCMVGNESTLVFCNHREAVERISDLLDERGIFHDIFHGGMKQEDRERSLIKFRNGSYNILITTDLASRGLDIPEVRNIVHYQLPTTPEAFTHRNGRTARMNANGTAFFVLAEDDYLPDFVADEVPEFDLIDDCEPPKSPYFATLYFDAGKKDKINKIDIVGLLYKKGGLSKNEVGMVEVLDFSAFAAVPRIKIRKLLQILRDERIKNKRVRIRESY